MMAESEAELCEKTAKWKVGTEVKWSHDEQWKIMKVMFGGSQLLEYGRKVNGPEMCWRKEFIITQSCAFGRIFTCNSCLQGRIGYNFTITADVNEELDTGISVLLENGLHLTMRRANGLTDH